jgi:hypothetical protein
MARFYTVSFTGTLTTAGTDADLFNLLAADDKPIRLRALILSQSSEVGDAAEENLRITIQRFPATVTNGSGGSAVTPQTLDSADAAAGFTARCNDTTVATTSGTAVKLEEFAWNERASPLERWWPDERFAPVGRQTEALIVRCESTAADDLTIELCAYVEEL